MIVISDLHLGVGRDAATGQWDAMEDFRWAAEFELFLAEIDRLGDGRTDLVLNGDTIELWQSLQDDCDHPDDDLGCTETEVLLRLRHVLGEHRPELSALAAFGATGDNRVIIVPGNHDAGLLFDRAATATLSAIGAPEGRVRIEPAGYWLSEDGRIYAEHGHQIGEEVNRFDDWPTPFVSHEAQYHLQRPWGEAFVQDYYNRFEQRYPIIDNILSIGTALRHAAAAEGILGASVAYNHLLKFVLLDLSWNQFGQALGTETEAAPEWDVPSIRAAGQAFFVESLTTDDPLRPSLESAVSAGELELSLDEFSDRQILAICEARAARRRSQVLLGRTATITECPRIGVTTLGAASAGLLRSRDLTMGDHLGSVYSQLEASGQASRPFDVFVYSHTHTADAGFSPLTGPWRPLVVNTGAWQRVISTEAFHEERSQRGLSNEDAFREIRVEELPACYSFIRIEPYEEEPRALLRFWKMGAAGDWGIGVSCE